MGEDCIHIDPNSPTSDRINVYAQGEKDDVAESKQLPVLKVTFGKKEAFFATSTRVINT